MTSIQTLNRRRSVELLRLLRDFQVGDRYDCILAEEVMGWERVPNHFSSPANVPMYRVVAAFHPRGHHYRVVQYGTTASTWTPTGYYPHANEAFTKANVTSEEWIFVCDYLTPQFTDTSTGIALRMSLAALIKHRKLFPDFWPQLQTGIKPI